MAPSLKSSQIVGEAKRLLEAGQFSDAGHVEAVPACGSSGIGEADDQANFADVGPSREILIFEDARSIVGLIFYPTWVELEANWEFAQAAMVMRISEHIRRGEPKSWDGYLVLLTLDEAVPTEAVNRVRHDTHRLRKLVTTGRELTSMAAVEATLRPVLPFETTHTVTERATPIERLPKMLEDSGLDPQLVTSALASFRENRSPMAGIWSWRQAQ